MKRLINLLFLLIFICPYPGNAQSTEEVDLVPPPKPVQSSINGRTVTFTQLLREMEKAQSWTEFRDLKVVFSHDVDKKGGMDEWFVKKNKALVFRAPHIWLYNCEFDNDYWLVLHNATFEGHLTLVGCKNVKAIFDSCTFMHAVRLMGNEFEFARFDKCRFEMGFRFTRGEVADNLTFSKCVFDYNSRFIGLGGGFDMDDRMFYISNKLDGIDIVIDSCLFKKNEQLEIANSFVDLSESQYKNLIIQNSRFETGLNLERSVVAGYLDLSDNYIGEGILPNGMTYNFNNSSIIWDDLKRDKISILDRTHHRLLNKTNVNDAFDQKNLNRLISSYTAIFSAYKSQGNKQWANACYYQWKEVETEGYYKEKEITSYILNKFLAIFCDYGTNPIKAAKCSVLIIFLFSLLYMFIPFDDIRTVPSGLWRRRELLRKLRESPGNFATLYIRETHAFRSKYPHHSSPRVMRFKVWLFDRVESLSRSTFNKRLRGYPLHATFRLMILFSRAQHYFPKFLHSVVLSMNAFVTLGFGSMKVKGDYIYLSILEGIFGWFLLSIFTVSLINQIINW